MNPAEYLRSISPGVVRQKFRLSRNDSGVWGDGFDDEGTIILRSTEVSADGDWQIEAPAIRSLTPAERHRGLVQTGDLIITTSSGSRRHIGKTALVDDPVAALGCAFANFMQRLRVRKGQEPRFYRYLLNAPVGREQMFYLGSTTTGLMNLNGTVLGNIEVPDAPPETQRAIAAFLDRKTAAIDDLIDKKERLIKLLAEKRAALIHRTVTKGLDDGVPMKDSGVPWIGEIPAHWDAALLRLLARIESGHTPSRQHPEYWVPEECSIPWFSLADVWQLRDARQTYLGETSERISPRGMANSAARRLPVGTVVLSRTASVGFAGIMPVSMATTQDFANWVCGPLLDPEYLLWMFRGMKSEFDRLMMGSTHQTIYMPDLRKFKGPIPPIIEQERIVSVLGEKVNALDGVVDRSAEQLDKLREYRQALITAAVTGQIDVPVDTDAAWPPASQRVN